MYSVLHKCWTASLKTVRTRCNFCSWLEPRPSGLIRRVTNITDPTAILPKAWPGRSALAHTCNQFLYSKKGRCPDSCVGHGTFCGDGHIILKLVIRNALATREWKKQRQILIFWKRVCSLKLLDWNLFFSLKKSHTDRMWGSLGWLPASAATTALARLPS